ncbi:MAG: ISAs1 family transposase [Chloroflexi bacterium]|nr:ISAs1 family transposase [Chloroflexota bacterium]
MSPKATHGRQEVRTLWSIESADLNRYVGSSGDVGKPWPGVAQVSRIQRVVKQKDRQSGLPTITAEVEYAITSLNGRRADARGLLTRWRVHWHIENRDHWVRDVTFGEDESPIHLGQAPEVFSILRNAAIALLGMGDFPSKAAGVRGLGARPEAVVEFFRDLTRKLRQARPKMGRDPVDPTPHTRSSGPSPLADGARRPVASTAAR